MKVSYLLLLKLFLFVCTVFFNSVAQGEQTVAGNATQLEIDIQVVTEDKLCLAGCSSGGTCNPELGRCDCPPFPAGHSGTPCNKPTMPACELQPGFYSPCGKVLAGRTSCECLDHCDKQNLMYSNECYDIEAAKHDPATQSLEHFELQKKGFTGELPMVDWHSRKQVRDQVVNDLNRRYRSDPLENCEGKCNNRGFCNHGHCTCFFGFRGRACEQQDHDVFCMNGCSGNGKCISGFCHCTVGYYGVDCSLTPADKSHFPLTAYQRWAANHPDLVPPNAPQPKPRIYIYELPPKFNAHFLYHHHPHMVNGIYSAGRFLHSRLLHSEFRTTDPSTADYFFVPIWGRASAFGPPRRQSRLLLEIQAYIRSTWPYYDRKNGSDHMWVLTDDAGACDEFAQRRLVPELKSNIFLTHFGYTGGTFGYAVTDQNGCYRPGHDVVIPPSTRDPSLRGPSDLARDGAREIKFLFTGDARTGKGPTGRDGFPNYSHGVRQRVVKNLYGVEGFKVKEGRNPTYAKDVQNAQFCLAPSGAGWGIRIAEVIVSGCIPVIIQDNVTQPFEEVLPYSKFAIRVPEKDIENLPVILGKYSQDDISRMREELACAWKAFTWGSIHGSYEGEDGTQDAFAMLMYVLRERLLSAASPNQKPESSQVVNQIVSMCNPIPQEEGVPQTKWPLCSFKRNSHHVCPGMPSWFWIGPSFKNWAPGGAAAVSRPFWFGGEPQQAPHSEMAAYVNKGPEVPKLPDPVETNQPAPEPPKLEERRIPPGRVNSVRIVRNQRHWNERFKKNSNTQDRAVENRGLQSRVISDRRSNLRRKTKLEEMTGRVRGFRVMH